MRFEHLIRPSVKHIKEYIPGKSVEEIRCISENIIKLGSNENVLGASPLVARAIKENAEKLHIYPSYDAFELKQALSEYTGYSVDNLVVSGSGMDGIIDTLMRLFLSPYSETIIPIPTFSYYEITTLAHGGKPVFVNRNSDFEAIPEEILNKVSSNTRMIFLCSPNNPTGNVINEENARTIIESVNSIVFIDEAYVEFSEKSLIGLVKEYDNLVIGRTFSKAFALAGMRIGYAIAPSWICKEYMKVMTPFSVDVLSSACGIAALKDKKHLRKTIEMVKKGREQLIKSLESLCKVYPSEANFVLIDVSPKTSSEVSELLLKQGIIVRDCASFRGAGNSLIRITIGKKEQNERVIQALHKIL